MNTLARRGAALVIDMVAATALCLLLSTSAGLFLSSRAVSALEIGNPESLWRGSIPMVISIRGSFFFALPFAQFLVFITEPISGATPGKLITRLRVTLANGAHASLSVLWKRTLIKSAGLWLFTLALLAGMWEMVAVAIVVATFNVLGGLLAIGGNQQALHDRLGRTVVQDPHRTT